MLETKYKFFFKFLEVVLRKPRDSPFTYLTLIVGRQDKERLVSWKTRQCSLIFCIAGSPLLNDSFYSLLKEGAQTTYKLYCYPHGAQGFLFYFFFLRFSTLVGKILNYSIDLYEPNAYLVLIMLCFM